MLACHNQTRANVEKLTTYARETQNKLTVSPMAEY